LLGALLFLMIYIIHAQNFIFQTKYYREQHFCMYKTSKYGFKDIRYNFYQNLIFLKLKLICQQKKQQTLATLELLRTSGRNVPAIRRVS
jgi:hypothetical protein